MVRARPIAESSTVSGVAARDVLSLTTRRQIVDGGKVVAWLRVEAAVSGRRITTVTALFKEAVLSQYQRIHGEVPGDLTRTWFQR